MKYCFAVLFLALFVIAMAEKTPQAEKEVAPKTDNARNKRGGIVGGYPYNGYPIHHHVYPYNHHIYPYHYPAYSYAYHNYPYGYHNYPYYRYYRYY